MKFRSIILLVIICFVASAQQPQNPQQPEVIRTNVELVQTAITVLDKKGNFVEGLQRENLTALLAVEASALNGGHGGALPEESIADTVIRLRMEDMSRATVRSTEPSSTTIICSGRRL